MTTFDSGNEINNRNEGDSVDADDNASKTST